MGFSLFLLILTRKGILSKLRRKKKKSVVWDGRDTPPSRGLGREGL